MRDFIVRKLKGDYIIHIESVSEAYDEADVFGYSIIDDWNFKFIRIIWSIKIV